MDGNIERAIAGARSEAAGRINQFQRQREVLQESLHSPNPLRIRGKKIDSNTLQEADSIIAGKQKGEENHAFFLGSISDLSFNGEDGWSLQASMDGVEVTVKKIVREGRSLFSVLVGGQAPSSDERFKAFAKEYSRVVDEIRDQVRIQEIQEEMKGGTRAKGVSKGESVNPRDHLGHFKVLGMDPDALEGLSEEEIEARIKANYRVSAMHAHPDKQSGADNARMIKLNEAREVLLDSQKRQDYMNRRGEFDPRRK